MGSDPPSHDAIAPRGAPSFRRLLQSRPFFLLWSAEVISQSGDFIFSIALLWLVITTTGSLLYLGVTGATIVLPGVVIAPFAGVLVDRFDRRRTLLGAAAAQGLITLTMSILYLVGGLTFPILLLLVFFLNAGSQFTRVATGVLVPRIVRKEDLAGANGLLSVTGPANQLASLSIGGVVIGLLGVGVPILYDSATFFAAVIILTFLKGDFRAVGPSSASEGAPGQSGWGQFREGIRYLIADRVLVGIIVLGVVVNFFGAAIDVLVAPYARSLLHGTAALYGFLMATFALGLLLGSLFGGKMDLRPRAGRVLLLSAIGAGACIATLGILVAVVPAFLLIFGVGLTIALTNLPANTLIQARVPDRLLGRVSASLVAAITASQPPAALLGGALAHLLGLANVFLLSGIAIAVVSAAGFVVFRSLADATY